MAIPLLIVTTLIILALLGLWLHRPSSAGRGVTDSSHRKDPSASPAERDDPLGFRQRLTQALEQDRASLGLRRLSVLRSADLGHPWPLEHDERRTGHSERIWFVEGDCTLPGRVDFDAEVVAAGDLRTQSGCKHHALMADGDIDVASATHVASWVHAQRVHVASGADVGGMVSAGAGIRLAPGASFHALNAPVIHSVDAMDRAGARLAGTFAPLTEEEGVYWDPRGRRGHTLAPLSITALRSWEGDLISRSDVRLGEGCAVRGHIRCHGDLTLQAGCCVEGSLSAYGEIFLSPGCQISGDIQCDDLLTVGPGCVIGSPEHPVTLRVAQLNMAKGVVLHGRVCLANHWVDWRRRGAPRGAVTGVAVPSAAAQTVLGLGVSLGGNHGVPAPEWTLGLPGATWQAGAAPSVIQTQAAQATIASNHAWEGRLSCPGHLHVAEGCRAIGSIHAGGSVLLEAGVLVLGDIECGEDLRISGGTQLGGSLRSRTAIHLGPGCVIGSENQPVVVDAPTVTIGLGTVIHGQVRTHRLGGRTLPAVASGGRLIHPAPAHGSRAADPHPRDELAA